MSDTSRHSGAATAELVHATAPWRPDVATASPKDLGSHLTGTLLLVLGGLAALGALSTNIILPSVPAMAGAFGVSTPTLGVMQSAFLIAFAVGQLFVGPLSDRFGRSAFVVGGLAVFVAGSLACAIATGLPELIAGRIVQGLGASAASMLARAIARDLFEGEALARVLALTMVAMAAAPGFSPLLGGALDHLVGWPSTFLILGALAAVVAVAYAVLVGETHHRSRRIALHPVSVVQAYGRLAVDHRFFLPATAMALLMGGLFAMFTASPAILMDGLGFSAIQLGSFFAATVFLVFAAGLLAPRLAARHDPGRVAMAGLVIAFVGGALLLGLKAADAGGLAAYAAPVSVFLFGMGLANPLGTAMTLSPFGDRAGLASALLGFVQMAGAAVGATLATSLALTPVAALGSVLTSFLGLAILLFAARRDWLHHAGRKA